MNQLYDCDDRGTLLPVLMRSVLDVAYVNASVTLFRCQPSYATAFGMSGLCAGSIA